MRSNYKTLGNYIQMVDERNRGGEIDYLLGVSINKQFIPSIANIVGTDLSNYKIVRTGQFAYGPVTSRNGEKISIALLRDKDCIISSAYTVFEVINKEELDPEYLMLWFSRPEFDRYARYMSHGSVREIFGWDEMCKVELPVPPIEKQHSIVKAYQTITDRMILKQKINENLEATAQTIFNEMFAPYYLSTAPIPTGWQQKSLSEICQVKGGKRLPSECEFSNIPTQHPYIRIRDMYQGKYVELSEDFQYIDDSTFSYIQNYVVSSGDIIIAIVGVTAGEISFVGNSLNNANLTENCVKLTNIQDVPAEYIYEFWQFLRQNGEIKPLLVGAAQPKLPIYNIQSVKVLIPDEKAILKYRHLVEPISETIKNNIYENRCLAIAQKNLLSQIFSC